MENLIITIQNNHPKCSDFGTDNLDLAIAWLKYLAGYYTPEQFLEVFKALMPEFVQNNLPGIMQVIQSCAALSV